MSDTMQEQVEGISMQDYFDETIRHLVEQGERSYDRKNEQCSYLNQEGLKCAVGIHIPDGHDAQYETGDVYELEEYSDLAGAAWPDSDKGLLLAYELQKLHDWKANWHQEKGFIGWEAAKCIVDQFALSDAIIQELKGGQDD